MKKENRLLAPEDFKRVMNGSKACRSDSYLVFAKPNELGKARYGISTSKKLGKAVIRVRCRRQVRAYVSIYNRYEIGYDIVIVVRPGFLKKTSAENQDILLKALRHVIESQRQEITKSE